MTAISTGLPDIGAPFEWAVLRSGILYTAQVPIRSDGSFETGAFEQQAELTFANLFKTVRAAGGNVGDLVQVLIYLTDAADIPKMNEVYRRFFSAPFPVRATFVIAALAIPGMRIEVLAQAHIAKAPG